MSLRAGFGSYSPVRMPIGNQQQRLVGREGDPGRIFQAGVDHLFSPCGLMYQIWLPRRVAGGVESHISNHRAGRPGPGPGFLGRSTPPGHRRPRPRLRGCLSPTEKSRPSRRNACPVMPGFSVCAIALAFPVALDAITFPVAASVKTTSPAGRRPEHRPFSSPSMTSFQGSPGRRIVLHLRRAGAGFDRCRPILPDPAHGIGETGWCHGRSCGRRRPRRG